MRAESSPSEQAETLDILKPPIGFSWGEFGTAIAGGALGGAAGGAVACLFGTPSVAAGASAGYVGGAVAGAVGNLVSQYSEGAFGATEVAMAAPAHALD